MHIVIQPPICHAAYILNYYLQFKLHVSHIKEGRHIGLLRDIFAVSKYTFLQFAQDVREINAGSVHWGYREESKAAIT